MSRPTSIKWFHRSTIEVTMPGKQLTYGQFETPADVADMLLAFCLTSPEDRILDPSCGNGAILARAAQIQRWLDPDRTSSARLWGVELDPEAAAQAQSLVPEAHIIGRNFFEMQPWPDGPFDAIVGNPPYTRAEWISRVDKDETISNALARQLSMFDDVNSEGPASKRRGQDGPLLSKRAGLHAYFFIHGTQFVREGGRFGFVVPNSWLDVAYGERLKQYLLEHYKVIALVESNVERWFSQARINTCLVILEKCSDSTIRANNQVNMVRIRRPLREMIPFEKTDSRRLHFLKELTDRMMSETAGEGDGLSVRGVPQKSMAPAEKWGYILRAPPVLLRRSQAIELHPLKSWATVKRGFTTGANAFFYLNQDTIEKWEIEPEYRRPLLKSFRHLKSRRVGSKECDLELLSVQADDLVSDTAVGEYIAWGESQGIHRRRTCSGRKPWYGLPQQVAPPLLLAKGIWQRHFAPVVEEAIVVDQQLYMTYFADGTRLHAAAALLNSAWFELQLELHGRVNFGEGVLWLASYEIENLLLLDPRYLPAVQVDELASTFKGLLDRPVGNIRDEVSQPDWQALNAVVFDILGLSPSEGLAITEALLERISTRQAKASASH